MMRQAPGVLDIQILHSSIREWLPGNPDNNSLVRPNHETVQLYLQLIEEGFECNLIPRMTRQEGSMMVKGGGDTYNLVLCIEYGGHSFDARDQNPFQLVEMQCNSEGKEWNWGDPVDMAIAHRMIYHIIETVRTIPNMGLARSIDGVIAGVLGDYMQEHTAAAGTTGTASGRL